MIPPHGLSSTRFKHPDRCVGHDIAKLVECGLIQTRDGLAYHAVSAAGGGAAQASTSPQVRI